MRGTRWLLLVAIAAILGGVAIKYRAQKKVLQEQAPPRPSPLPVELNASAQDWVYSETNNNHTTAEIRAKGFQQVKDSSRVDLENVQIKLFHKDEDAYDLVKSGAASYFSAEHRLYSEGEVEITLGVPVAGQSKHRLVSIKSSGVNFDSTTGRADTDRASSFLFENGDGRSTGASYDPATRELFMKKDVELDWKPTGPHARPMKIEAPTLSYHEATSVIWLKPWGKMTRGDTVVEGGDAVVHLEDRAIRQVEALQARGSDTYPNRKLDYSAGYLVVDFDDDGAMRKLSGTQGARLVSTSEASETTMTAERVALDFEARDNQSVLTCVTGNGKGVVTAKPLPAPGRQLGETHVLKSESIEMKMRPDGREIANIVTHAPGTLEFLPNLPAQHHRTLDAQDLFIDYGPLNRIESFRATQARTITDPTEEERKRSRTPALTTSRELLAHFEPKTSRMASMEQWGDFTYDEGDRKARAAKATLDSNQNVILLETSARMWDATGSTSADHIRLDQRTGNFTAEGGVNSSRLPEKDRKKNSEMLSGDEPLQAQARRMESSNRNRSIHYEGNVTMWQGANRIQADAIDVNREKRTLVAAGHVVTNLWEEPKDEPKKKSASPVLTEVRAPHLVYTEEGRLAVYTGGVVLQRPGLQVKSTELRAFLAESGADSRLEKAFADGAVQIAQAAKDRSRTGTAGHSEYYTDDQKVILRGGRPKLVEVLKGSAPSTTEGDELTYFANDDRLLVSGAPNDPARSRITRNRK